MSTEKRLLTLNAPPALEDTLIDWLLAHPDCPGFSAVQIAGHSRDTRSYSIMEQVTGRQRRVQIQIMLDAQACSALITHLHSEFSHAGIRYWVTPLVEEGRL